MLPNLERNDEIRLINVNLSKITFFLKSKFTKSYVTLRKKGKTKKRNFFPENNVIKRSFTLRIFEKSMYL